MEAVTVQIEGMSCGHCLNAVSQALSGLPGVAVQSVRIGRAEVDYDPAQANPGQITAAIEEAGYRAMVAS